MNQRLWQELSQNVTAEMGAWRQAHPKATLRAIELELDARVKAGLLLVLPHLP